MEHIFNLINSYLPEPHASLAIGILLGRKLEVTPKFYDDLKAVGLVHIVVLSGMNISLMSAMIMNTAVNFIHKKYAIILTIVTIAVFIWIIGPQAPLVRAGIMGCLSLIGLLYGRKTISLFTLFISCIIMLIFNHSWISSLSFQLSVGATLGIILFGSEKKEDENDLLILKKKKINNSPLSTIFSKFIEYLKDELRISCAAQVFTMPLIFWTFRQISIISPLANIIVAWMIGPIMILTAITILVGSINSQAGFVLSWSIYPLLDILVRVVEWGARIPYGFVTF